METTLIVTEKPDAALHVAEALCDSDAPKRLNVDGVPFFEVRNNKQRILVCSALGHLYVVASEGSAHSQYPIWEFAWKPKYLVERGQRRQERWVRAIARVSREARWFVDACDYDVEGSLIGYMILKYACQGADQNARRMKFSTLTPAELRDAYTKALPHLNFPLISAGMCRHEVDWLFGINLSRALIQSAYKFSGRYTTLSTGRVQGPTLRFLVEREREIETFVPTPYWAIRVQLEVDGEVLQAEYERDRLATEAEAREVVHACAGKSGEVKKVEFNRSQISPPIPFDLPSLQDEAYRHFGLTPRFSLAIAEHLYLDQLISYPRTSSQKLPTSIGYERIVKHLGQLENYRLEANSLLRSGELKPVQGKRDDPAHPAVYPTGTRPKRHLENREQRVFDLVVRRFLATFGTSAVQGREKAVIKVGEHTYLLRGSRLIEKGWTALYTPYAKFEDNALPSLNVGQRVLVHDIRSEQKFTQPPSHYNPSSLLRKMEESEIGTKATRADIIETLYRRGYVTGQRMSATPLGSRIIEILTKYCPRVVDVNFTTELESKMEEIELGSRSREQVVLETIDYLKPIIEALKLRERELGEELNAIIVEMREESTTLSVPCPQCGSKLKIARNPRTGKRFIGCSGKWKSDCKFSLPLPQVGSLSLLHKLCPTCGFQLVQVKSRGRKPLVSCCKCYAAKPSGLSRIRPISSIQTNGSS